MSVRASLRPELGEATSSSLVRLTEGRPAVINFFASFCTACEAEMQTFARAARNASGVGFVGIDTNDPNPAKALQLLTRAGVRYPVLVDSSRLEFARAFGIANLPTTFFIDARGRVVREVLGTESASELERNLGALRSSTGA